VKRWKQVSGKCLERSSKKEGTFQCMVQLLASWDLCAKIIISSGLTRPCITDLHCSKDRKSSDYNKNTVTMVTNNKDVGCPKDRVIWIYIASYLALSRKLPNKTPTQFNQPSGLVLNFILKVSNLVHIVTKQAYEKINLVLQRTCFDKGSCVQDV
jgi:hypothetical protein